MASQWWPGERNVAPATAATTTTAATAATTTGTDKLTIVLAARTHDENGFPRVPLLARSLTKFLAYEAVLEMLVVCPDPDVGTFQRLDALRAMRWPLRVVPDSALLSLSEHNFERVTPAEEWAVGGGRGANYRMQMLTKISVASLVRSDFYLVLDCDVLATRRTQLTDLVPNPNSNPHPNPHPHPHPNPNPNPNQVRGGKALYAAKPFEYERHRRTWWTAADRILQARGCVTNFRGSVIGVTPAILSTNISRGAMARVGALHSGRAWDESLFRLRLDEGLDWTEYTLYWTAACVLGLAETLHMPPHGVELYEESAFDWGAWQAWDAARAFADDSFVFTVIQSIGGAPTDWVAEQVEPFLKVNDSSRG